MLPLQFKNNHKLVSLKLLLRELRLFKQEGREQNLDKISHNLLKIKKINSNISHQARGSAHRGQTYGVEKILTKKGKKDWQVNRD